VALIISVVLCGQTVMLGSFVAIHLSFAAITPPERPAIDASLYQIKIMKPKTINALYWIFTILFCALMIFSSWSSILVNEDSVKLIHGWMGYPKYFIPFTGWAKLLGALVLLVPGYPRIKEWAYAGLFFDLAAVIYSGIAVSGTFDPLMLTMLIWIVPGILSYIFWNKKLKLDSTKKELSENKREAALAY
jgi:hypothetical protein